MQLPISPQGFEEATLREVSAIADEDMPQPEWFETLMPIKSCNFFFFFFAYYY